VASPGAARIPYSVLAGSYLPSNTKSKRKKKNASKQPKTMKARGDWTYEAVEAGGKKPEAEPVVTKKKRKKTKEKRACQQLAPPWWHAPGFMFPNVEAKLTGTPTARGLSGAFLPSRPLKRSFRMFFRSNFRSFVRRAQGRQILSTPSPISGWPHHLNPSL
jgi:hypothetical protein